MIFKRHANTFLESFSDSSTERKVWLYFVSCFSCCLAVLQLWSLFEKAFVLIGKHFYSWNFDDDDEPNFFSWQVLSLFLLHYISTSLFGRKETKSVSDVVWLIIFLWLPKIDLKTVSYMVPKALLDNLTSHSYSAILIQNVILWLLLILMKIQFSYLWCVLEKLRSLWNCQRNLIRNKNAQKTCSKARVIILL